jgi:hypothetical protein
MSVIRPIDISRAMQVPDEEVVTLEATILMQLPFAIGLLASTSPPQPLEASGWHDAPYDWGRFENTNACMHMAEPEAMQIDHRVD